MLIFCRVVHALKWRSSHIVVVIVVVIVNVITDNAINNQVWKTWPVAVF
jgi:hypothetical protein